jgi:hypothetical protein
MVLAGVWFGLVVGYGIWRYANRSLVAVVAVIAATWAAWQVAGNLAMQMAEYYLKISAIPDTPRYYLTGFVAGAVGALLTWAGMARFSPDLKNRSAAVSVGAAGAVLGLLLPQSLSGDPPIILFVPWQAGVAATLGWFLAKPAGAR